ncbi:MAG TPA: D-aminoacylase [Blastocatellia bacterium]|nr:D-aminoacylase [Blastocatellia bacterium]
MKKLWGWSLLFVALFVPVAAQTTSTLIIKGKVIDGTGAKAKGVALRLVGDTVTEIGNLKPKPNERVIDARNLIIAPGFIDIHNHSETGLEREPTANSQILQGITTLAVGPDGGSPWPIAAYLQRRAQKPPAVNVLTFVGHATVRRKVLGDDYNRTATKAEIEQMAALVEQGMREGAIGLSSGLEYDVGLPSTTEEVIALARVAAQHGGIYMSHIRDEADAMLNALKEAIRIGREAKIPVQVSHIKMGTVGVWGKAPEAIAMIEEARREGLDVTADCYPYDAWSSTITVLIPSRKHDDPREVSKGLNDVGGAANVTITSCAHHREYEGKTLQQLADENKTTAVEMYMNIVKAGGAGVVCRSMIDKDIEAFYRQPWVMVSSDGGINARHPRGAGTFPRVLGRFVREKKWLSLPEAVRKMTSAPAARLNLKDRGVLRVGAKADVVIFDAKKVLDHATFKQPFEVPVGIVHVFVNGEQVVSESKVSGATPGRVLRR